MTTTNTTTVTESRRRWARELLGTTGYLLALFPFAWVSFSVIISLFSLGLGLIVLVFGLPILVAALYVARGSGTAERHMLRWTGRPAIAAPQWPLPAPDASAITRMLTPMRSGHGWSYFVHQLLMTPILSTISFSFTVTWWAGALGGLTFWLWQPLLPGRSEGNDWPGWVGAHWLPWLGWDSVQTERALYTIAGLFFALTLPFVVRGFGKAHHALATVMLGRWRSDDLAVAVQEEAAARKSAVQAEDSAMRRLERDLHDGPQQRLVRLQMDLAAAARKADAGDNEHAAHLAREAQDQAKAALDELRALSRGVAPPLLIDRGLVAALESLAADASLPVDAHLDPAIDSRVDNDIARAVYFVVAELLTNVAKHAQASHADLTAGVRDEGAPRLVLSVSDDGVGGAVVRPDHGLVGLRDRVQGLRGTLTVESPQGGPTRVDVMVPLSSDWTTFPTTEGRRASGLAL